MPRPREQYLIRPRLSRPRCQLLYRALSPTMGLAKSLFVPVLPSLLLYLIATLGANRGRVRETAATLADKIRYRRPGVPNRLNDGVSYKLDRRI